MAGSSQCFSSHTITMLKGRSVLASKGLQRLSHKAMLDMIHYGKPILQYNYVYVIFLDENVVRFTVL